MPSESLGVSKLHRLAEENCLSEVAGGVEAGYFTDLTDTKHLHCRQMNISTIIIMTELQTQLLTCQVSISWGTEQFLEASLPTTHRTTMAEQHRKITHLYTVHIYILVAKSESKFYPVTSLDVSGAPVGCWVREHCAYIFTSESSVVHLRPSLYTA